MRITNARGFQNIKDNAIAGMNKGADAFVASPIPVDYAALPVSHLDASAQDVAYLYAAYAWGRETGAAEATSFEDALRQHRLIDQITQTSDAFSK